MNLFGYYAWHSVKNQLKKMFKTWVLVFLVVCMLIGGIIGAGAAKLSEIADEQNQGTEIELPGDIDLPIDDPVIDIPEDPGRIGRITEAIAGVAILGLLILFIKGADKNGSAIFQPADVTLLFTSPMKPQAVLAFRMMCTIGLVLFTSVYMLFQIPNLVLNVGMSVWEALSLLLAWFFVFLFGQVIKIFLYTICSTKEKLKKYITPGMIGIVGVAVLGLIVFHLTHKLTPLESAEAYINSGISRYIPIWGWTKGIVGSAFEGSISGVLLYSGLNILAATAIVAVTWNIKADFYEDAMAKSEETAAIMRDIQESGGLYARRRKKDRSEKLLRDDFHHGFGANVYYYKSMYNRRRFAMLGFFTKTNITYIAAALAVSLLFTFVFEGDNGLTVTALVLGVMVFYRSLGNPLEADTKSQYFVLIPEPVGKKIFFSLLGSTVNCLLDLAPALLIACVILKASPLNALAWALFMGSIDAYATIVGAFINLSVPVSAGATIKQLVQIMFIYAIISTIVNLVLAAVFFALSTNFISPRSRRVEGVDMSLDELSTGKSTFSRVCFVPIVMAVVALAVDFVISIVVTGIGLNVDDIPGFVWLYNFVPMYAIGLPLGYLVIKKIPAQLPEKNDLKFIDWLKTMTVCIAFMYIGNIVGSLVNYLITSISGYEPDFAVGDLISGSDTVWIVIFVVIIGPIVEELIFRKLFIDRAGKYGYGLAIACSALAFGLFHGNLNQFFYATALGLIFGYIYVRTGKLIYTITLHMAVNFIGSVVSSFIVDSIDADAIDEMVASGNIEGLMSGGFVIFFVYILVILTLVILGLIVFFGNLRKIELPPSTMPIKKEYRFRTAYLSLGFICVFVYSLVMTVITFTGLGG